MANQPAILGSEQQELLKFQAPDVGAIRSALQQKGIKNVWEGGAAGAVGVGGSGAGGGSGASGAAGTAGAAGVTITLIV